MDRAKTGGQSICRPSFFLFSFTDHPIGSGVARTWFGFRYQDEDQGSQYYSFNVMHIDSQWKDHGLLTQLHGSFHPFNIKIENSKTNFYSRSKTNFHSRSKTNEGKEKFLNPKRCGGGGSK